MSLVSWGNHAVLGGTDIFYSRVVTLITGVGAITAAAAGSKGAFWPFLSRSAGLRSDVSTFRTKLLQDARSSAGAVSRLYGALASFLVDTLALRLERGSIRSMRWWFVLARALSRVALAGLEFLLVARRHGVPVLKESVNTAAYRH